MMIIMTVITKHYFLCKEDDDAYIQTLNPDNERDSDVDSIPYNNTDDDFPNKLAGCRILLNIGTRDTYTITYVFMYQTMEFGIKVENFLFEVEGNGKYSRVKLKIRFYHAEVNLFIRLESKLLTGIAVTNEIAVATVAASPFPSLLPTTAMPPPNNRTPHKQPVDCFNFVFPTVATSLLLV